MKKPHVSELCIKGRHTIVCKSAATIKTIHIDTCAQTTPELDFCWLTRLLKRQPRQMQQSIIVRNCTHTERFARNLTNIRKLLQPFIMSRWSFTADCMGQQIASSSIHLPVAETLACFILCTSAHASLPVTILSTNFWTSRLACYQHKLKQYFCIVD